MQTQLKGTQRTLLILGKHQVIRSSPGQSWAETCGVPTWSGAQQSTQAFSFPQPSREPARRRQGAGPRHTACLRKTAQAPPWPCSPLLARLHSFPFCWKQHGIPAATQWGMECCLLWESVPRKQTQSSPCSIKGLTESCCPALPGDHLIQDTKQRQAPHLLPDSFFLKQSQICSIPGTESGPGSSWLCHHLAIP